MSVLDIPYSFLSILAAITCRKHIIRTPAASLDQAPESLEGREKEVRAVVPDGCVPDDPHYYYLLHISITFVKLRSHNFKCLSLHSLSSLQTQSQTQGTEALVAMASNCFLQTVTEKPGSRTNS